jgi:hypothetical protein
MQIKPPIQQTLITAAAVTALTVFTLAVLPRHSSAQAGALDTAAIDRATGKTGQLAGEVYKVTFPRSDLHVTRDGVIIKPGLALTGWAAFKAVGSEAVVHGDLAVKEAEVNPVVGKLRQGQMEVTAIHNHLLGEFPRVMYVHFWGRGPAGQLASSLKAALALTTTPMTGTQAPAANDHVPGADRIQEVLGLKGTVNGGVLALSKPRLEAITMMGVTLPPSMGMATSMNVQAADAGKVAATGDFVLTGDEVNPVITALRTHGIDVTALHNHMIHGSPELYFMHFWAHDTPDRVAVGLKAALDAMGGKSSGMPH